MSFIRWRRPQKAHASNGPHRVTFHGRRDYLKALRIRLAPSQTSFWEKTHGETSATLLEWLHVALVDAVIVESPAEVDALSCSKWAILKKVSIVSPNLLLPLESAVPFASDVLEIRAPGNEVDAQDLGERAKLEPLGFSVERTTAADLPAVIAGVDHSMPFICIDYSGGLTYSTCLALMDRGAVIVSGPTAVADMLVEDSITGAVLDVSSSQTVAARCVLLQRSPVTLSQMSGIAHRRATQLCSDEARSQRWEAITSRMSTGRPRIIRVGSSKTLWTIQANQIRRQLSDGADVVLAVDGDEQFSRKLRSLGCPVMDIGMTRRPGLFELLRLAISFSVSLRRRGLLVHTHNVPATLMVRIALRLRANFASVETFHNMHDLLAPSRAGRASRAILRRSTGIVDQSLFITQDYLDSAIDSELADSTRSAVIGTGIDFERFRESQAVALPAESIREGIGVSPEIPIIMSIARLDPQKGHLRLLRAFAHLLRELDNPAALVLLGEGPEEATLRCLAAELGIEDVVLFLGQRDDVPHLLTVADVVVLASHHEGLGRCVLEGLLTGVPVVTTETDGPRLVLRNVERAWITAHSSTALSSAMAEALVGLSERELRANEEAIDQFDESRIALEMMDVYRRVHCS